MELRRAVRGAILELSDRPWRIFGSWIRRAHDFERTNARGRPTSRVPLVDDEDI
jgi:hypothetical protein